VTASNGSKGGKSGEKGGEMVKDVFRWGSSVLIWAQEQSCCSAGGCADRQ